MSERQYIDISIAGNNKKGDYITNNDALDNAFRLWISSERDEFLRRRGGNWLAQHLGKPMNDNRANLIKKSIQTGLSVDFQPALTIITLDVTPDYTNRRWNITLVGYSEELRVGLSQTYLVDNEV